MIKPAFLVEGDLEQKFVQNTCPGCPVQKINCNGDDVSVASIAKRVGTLGRLLHKKHSPLVVVFDREKRTDSPDEIESLFRKELQAEDIQVPVIVGIPDRDIENWILADLEVFQQAIGANPGDDKTIYEGQKGKTIIKKQLGQGRSYVETIDGVAWLKSCRPDIMSKNSFSFAKFAEALSGISCWWLKQHHLSEPTA